MSVAAGEFVAQPLPYWRRAVLKVGSSLLAGFPDQAVGSGLDTRHAAGLARFMDESRAQGREVVLVSSGAIAEGIKRLGWPRRPREIHELQAAAAVGCERASRGPREDEGDEDGRGGDQQ